MSIKNQTWYMTKTGIKKWAYEKNSQVEKSKENYFLDCENGELFIQLATDTKCPKREYFLFCLYLLVIDIIQRKENKMIHFYEPEMDELKYLLKRHKKSKHKSIRDWVENTLELLEDNKKLIKYKSLSKQKM